MSGLRPWLIGAALLASVPAFAAETAMRGTVVAAGIESAALRGNLLGIDPRRDIRVYLPPGYERGSKRYPVLYYVHNAHWSARRLFEENRLQVFVERAAARGQIGDLIVVAGDFTTPTGWNFFGNDVVAGRWMDHIAKELVPSSMRTTAPLPPPRAAASRATSSAGSPR